MTKLVAVTLTLALTACQIYTGPPEYAPQCALFEPVYEYRVEGATPTERADIARAVASWRAAGFDVRITPSATSAIRMAPARHPRLCYSDGTCDQAGQVQWVDGVPQITIYRHDLGGTYRTALHEIGHALAGNGCHPDDGDVMGEWAGPARITEDDVEFVRRSQMAERKP